MSYISIKISGTPYSMINAHGGAEGVREWTKQIIQQTSHLPKIKEACILKATFMLPPNKYPKDFPYGSNLDNLLKRFLDALNHTVFSEAQGKDSCVISMNVTKVKVDAKDAGAYLEILPVSPR